MQGRHCFDVRLQPSCRLGTEPGSAWHRVGTGSRRHGAQGGQLRRRRGYNQLAPFEVVDSLRLAKASQKLPALGAQPRFLRSGTVVDASVDDSAVVRALVGANLRLFLEHSDAGPGEALHEASSARQAHQAGSDNG